MTHQAPQNVQSSQSSHTVRSHGVISPQDKNPPNSDWIDSTVSQADDSSAETEVPGKPVPGIWKNWEKGGPHFQWKITEGKSRPNLGY